MKLGRHVKPVFGNNEVQPTCLSVQHSFHFVYSPNERV